jgi:hypothetical protein
MKRIIFMILPVVVFVLAFRPVKYHTVTGTITRDNGLAISAASVVVKGERIATVTARDGTYKVELVDKNATLIFSCVGYETQEVKVNGKSATGRPRARCTGTG